MGAKRAFQLFPSTLVNRLKTERRKLLDEQQRAAATAANAALAAINGKKLSEADKKEKAELEARVKLLGDLLDKFEDAGGPCPPSAYHAPCKVPTGRLPDSGIPVRVWRGRALWLKKPRATARPQLTSWRALLLGKLTLEAWGAKKQNLELVPADIPAAEQVPEQLAEFSTICVHSH